VVEVEEKRRPPRSGAPRKGYRGQGGGGGGGPRRFNTRRPRNDH